MECCNWNCEGHVWNKHIRCATCRRMDINTCVDCDSECTRRAFYCKSCRDGHAAAKLRTYWERHLGVLPECLMCEQQLPARNLKTCRGDCHKLYTQLYFMNRRGYTKLNEYYILERQ